MKKCLTLAKKGIGKVEPNPYVGAIVYDEDKDEIISQGYHKLYGSHHAEVNAINAAQITKGKTLIVNLEPCSHYGKTPPCADLIIKSGFKKVVVAMVDPNPLVKNQGIKKLKQAGIEVITGILEKEAQELNKVFIKNITTKKPYVMLKTATTLDSKIALLNKKSKWITNEKARYMVQLLRSKYQAIMSATGTILADNPQLNVRIKNKKSPIRIVFDPNNKVPSDYNVFKNDVKVIHITNFTNFNELFLDLYKEGVYSIMVEAGCNFNTQLLKAGEVDEINHFFAPKIFGSGVGFIDGIELDEINNCIELENIKIKQIEDNFLINGKIKKKEKI